VSKYLINAIGLALTAAGQSMIASAADMADLSEAQILTGDGSGTPLTPIIGGTPVSPAAIAAAELDAEGLPWDERLNASTKTKTDKGLWTKKKGVDDTTRATIVKQLREKYPAPGAAQGGLAGMTPPATGLGVPGMALPNMTPTPYQELCNWLAANTGDGKVLTSEWVTQQFTAASTTLADLATADAGLLKQWLDAFKGVLAQMQA
jgi:hypothetical protein